MSAGEPSRNSKTKTGPAGWGGGPPRKLGKKAFNIVVREAWSPIQDGEFQTPAVEACPENDFGAWRCVHSGVEQQIREGLLDEGLIQFDERKVGRDIALGFESGEGVTRQVEGGGAQLGDIAPIELRPHRTCFKASHVQEVIDNPV